MATTTLRYTLNDFHNIIYQGFDYKMSDKTLQIISEISGQVGSSSYIKTPVFNKRENPLKSNIIPNSANNDNLEINVRKKRGNKNMEIVNQEEWNSVKNFQTTKIEHKTGSDADIDLIRAYINKITEKNYIDMRNKIVDIVDRLSINNSKIELDKISTSIFDIASSNRYYSKIYADLYSDLSSKFDFIKLACDVNLNRFTDLFNNIEYVDSSENYDKFCEINKINEKRKCLAAFYINLSINNIISKDKIMTITRNLLSKIVDFICIENKKNEVDELTEIIGILYKKELYHNNNQHNYELINGLNINETIEELAKSKLKDYKSLTNKTLFKFMDLTDN